MRFECSPGVNSLCGIAGFAGIEFSGSDASDRLRAMCAAIQHRGPDSEGLFIDGDVAMGMRRLSIIDVSGGDQPISNEDGTVTVVFNGEIYNHKALRRRLEAAGHRFKTRSDTEVLVHLYEELGRDMLCELHGMFAFSMWDSKRRRLLLARDRSGMKPLSYMLNDGGIVYGSELRSLWSLRGGELEVSANAVTQYLAFGYVPEPSSIFCGVQKLPAGHFLEWQKGHGVEVGQYWSPPPPDPSLRNEVALVEHLRVRLDTAVASHLEADVPLGAFLSGGLDSSTVVALMARHAAGRVRTFSIGFSEQSHDESGVARAVAEHLGTDHRELIITPDVEAIFESIALMFDEPFGDSSAIPTFLVSKLARESVKVALSGDAGDELFGGYRRYRDVLSGLHFEDATARRIWFSVGRLLPHIFPGRNRILNTGRSRWGQFASTVVQPVRIDEGGIAARTQPGAACWVEDQLPETLAAGAGDDFASAMMRADFLGYLPGDILAKVDRASMAVSLEARVPFLDADLVDFVMRIPGDLKVTKVESKRLFRTAIAGLVPEFIMSRPKRGFSVPLAKWFRGPLRSRIQALRDPSSALAQYVDRPAVHRLVSEHLIGRRDHSVLLWRLIVLRAWLDCLPSGHLARPPSLPRMQFG